MRYDFEPCDGEKRDDTAAVNDDDKERQEIEAIIRRNARLNTIIFLTEQRT
jgi:hypothetical protein